MQNVHVSCSNVHLSATKGALDVNVSVVDTTHVAEGAAPWAACGTVTLAPSATEPSVFVPAGNVANAWVSSNLLAALDDFFRGDLPRVLNMVAAEASAECESYGATAVLLRAAAAADLQSCTEPKHDLMRTMLESVLMADDPIREARRVARIAGKAVEIRRVLESLEASDDDERTRPSIEAPAPVESATHLLRVVWGNGTSELIPCRDGGSLVIGPEGALPTTMVPRTCYGGDAGVDVIVRGAEVPLVELLSITELRRAAKEHDRKDTLVALYGAQAGEQTALDQLIRGWGDEPARDGKAQPEASSPEGTGTPDVCLESVRKVCWSLLEQAIEAVRAWPEEAAKTRLGRILPVLTDGLRRLAEAA